MSLHSINWWHLGHEPVIGTYWSASKKRWLKQIKWQFESHSEHVTRSISAINWSQIKHFTGLCDPMFVWVQTIDFFCFFKMMWPCRISMWLGGSFVSCKKIKIKFYSNSNSIKRLHFSMRKWSKLSHSFTRRNVSFNEFISPENHEQIRVPTIVRLVQVDSMAAFEAFRPKCENWDQRNFRQPFVVSVHPNVLSDAILLAVAKPIQTAIDTKQCHWTEVKNITWTKYKIPAKLKYYLEIRAQSESLSMVLCRWFSLLLHAYCHDYVELYDDLDSP